MKDGYGAPLGALIYATWQTVLAALFQTRGTKGAGWDGGVDITVVLGSPLCGGLEQTTLMSGQPSGHSTLPFTCAGSWAALGCKIA